MHNKYRVLFLALISMILFACASLLSGSVSTKAYVEIPLNASFVVIGSDNLTLTERNIQALLSSHMKSKGFLEVSDPSTANIALMYSYSIGMGKTKVSSSPDFVWGGQAVTSSTEYPRYFQMTLIDLKASRLPDKVEIIWQGEIYSEGASYNISWLAEYFIDEIFSHFGQTVTNKKFMKIVQ